MLHQRQITSNDCWRTCVASILNVEASFVPHFYELANWKSEVAEQMALLWLNDRGYHLMTVQYDGSADFESVLNIASKATNGLPYILSGKSKISKLNHAVICKGSEVILDPAIGKPNPKPFSGACREGFWVLEVIVKAAG